MLVIEVPGLLGFVMELLQRVQHALFLLRGYDGVSRSFRANSLSLQRMGPAGLFDIMSMGLGLFINCTEQSSLCRLAIWDMVCAHNTLATKGEKNGVAGKTAVEVGTRLFFGRVVPILIFCCLLKYLAILFAISDSYCTAHYRASKEACPTLISLDDKDNSEEEFNEEKEIQYMEHHMMASYTALILSQCCLRLSNKASSSASTVPYSTGMLVGGEKIVAWKAQLVDIEACEAATRKRDRIPGPNPGQLARLLACLPEGNMVNVLSRLKVLF